MNTEPEDDQVRLKRLNVVGGAVHMELIPPESFAAAFIETARASLGSAENYMEYELRDNETGERFAVVVQRVGKLTPHQAREAAEKERDELRETLTRLRNEAPEADAWVRLKDEIPRLFGRDRVEDLPFDSEYATALHDVLAGMKQIEESSDV